MSSNVLQRKEHTCKNYENNNALNVVESIKDYIFNNDCLNLSLDVSHLNVIDASKVIILCSTYHYAKYPHGEINWLVNSCEIKNLIKPLNLGNIKLITV